MSFYQCQKCKNVWQYSIKKCPLCFSVLEKNDGKEFKVIGVSKVSIPTLVHPKTPYFVLVLEDENKNRWTHKSLEKYKMGEKFYVKPIPGEKTVAVWRVKYDIPETIKTVVELIGGINVNQGSKILILPTLNLPKHPYFAENTSPQFLDGIIKFLIQSGADYKKIKVGAQSFNDFPIESSVQKSQLLEVCGKNETKPLDLSKTKFVERKQGNTTFEISEEAFNNDLIVNLPILKLDKKLGVKGASENTLKLLRKKSYVSLKYLYDYPKLITEAEKVLPKSLTIAEGISVQKETGHTNLVGLILASFNSLNIERVFAEITMKKDLPDYLKNIKIQDIPIAGRKIGELQYDVEKFY
jgi:uncharacterized protein (DUF362 family)